MIVHDRLYHALLSIVVVIFHNQQSDIDKLETYKRLNVFILITATILFLLINQ